MENLIEILEKFGIALLIAVVGWFASPLAKRHILKLSKKATDQGVFTFFGSFVSILIKIIAIVIALSWLGVDMSIIVGGFSAVGLGISLALKDNMANVAGGIQIIFTRPFEVGDYIKVEDNEGIVTRIEVMFVVLKTYNYQEIMIPNSSIVANTVINYSRDPKRRLVISIPLSLSANMEDVQPLFMKAVEQCPYVLQDEVKKVVVEKFYSTHMECSIYCWSTAENYWNALYDINQKIQVIEKEHPFDVPVTKVEMRH